MLAELVKSNLATEEVIYRAESGHLICVHRRKYTSADLEQVEQGINTILFLACLTLCYFAVSPAFCLFMAFLYQVFLLGMRKSLTTKLLPRPEVNTSMIERIRN